MVQEVVLFFVRFVLFEGDSVSLTGKLGTLIKLGTLLELTTIPPLSSVVMFFMPISIVLLTRLFFSILVVEELAEAD